MKNDKSLPSLSRISPFLSATPVNPTAEFTRHTGQFNVYDRRDAIQCMSYRRRDFYKITLLESPGLLHYAENGIHIDRPALMFSNPMVPYSWEPTSKEQLGYFCIFSSDFLANQPGNFLIPDSPFSNREDRPVFFLEPAQQLFVAAIFRRIKAEYHSDYPQKYALIYHYMQILVHEARKMQPVRNFFRHKNAASRITTLFLDLLDRQFPVEQSGQTLQLKRAADFADQLTVHVNHLNRAVKEVTGKTTSAWIAERIIQEAKSLLLHTDWNINEVAYALGFEYPSYFNNFFRKQTSQTPAAFRS